MTWMPFPICLATPALLAIVPRHAADHSGFGEADVEFGADRGMDCSCACKWYLHLEGGLGRGFGGMRESEVSSLRASHLCTSGLFPL